MLLSRAIPYRTVGVALVAASLATLATLAAVGLAGVFVLRHDPCGLPPGLSEAAQDAVAAHAMACEDLEHHRISLAEYRALIGLDVPRPATPAVQWASSVRGFSSEYTHGQWAATQALGAPDVYPRSGDDPHAWASLDADAPSEFIEVGFAQPQRIRELQIFETLSPGAISDVELITASGRRIKLAQPNVVPSGGAAISSFAMGCTSEPIVGARVTLASSKIAGWNEIDAIGATPCL
jgi:hypothetical protein